MRNVDDRYIMPFSVGNELSAESFKLAQYDNTYLLAGPRYKDFYRQYIRPRVLMYNGWIEGFHNTEYGVLPTLFLQKIGNGIINTLFSKPLILNTEDSATANIIATNFKKSKLNSAVKEGYGYALAGGSSLLKLNCDGNRQLKFETIPMDKFFIEANAYGEIEKVKCFVATYHDTISAEHEYYLCEERFFRYESSINKKFPLVHYTFYKTSSNIEHENTPGETLTWREIPYDIRKMLENDYGNIEIDNGPCESLEASFTDSQNYDDQISVYSKCKLLPFNDDLGCRLLKFTNNIAAFPKLPFGQPLADLLMNETYAYDQLKFFERIEVYLSRGRVMIDEGQVNPNDPDSKKHALDPMVFTYYDNTLGDTKDGKPLGIQLELRAEAIKAQKQNILNDTAFALNLSSSTIAAWLSDGTTQKTATEIEYERTKTDSFINDKIEIIRESIQELIDLYFHYYGVASPELHIMPENQTSRTDEIRLFSELYDKGQVTAKTLAEKILGTCSIKEVNTLAEYIDKQKQLQPRPQPGIRDAPLLK